MKEFEPNDDYLETADAICAIRDCIEGGFKIKLKRTEYLPDPSPVDTFSDEKRRRYSAYIAGAEFEEFALETERAMIGLMTKGEIEFVVPPQIGYLANDVDGDGSPLSGAIERTFKELLEVKFQVLLAEMSGLSGLDATKLSIADLKEINPKAHIKSYCRESLIDWGFRIINGVNQLSLMILKEESDSRNMIDFSEEENISYLVLALDENGDYFQQRFKLIENTKNMEAGEPFYPKIKGSSLKWIPAQIACDEFTPSGELPCGMGFLYAIADISLHMYRASADYKEALRLVQPTTFLSGGQQGDDELFKKLNGGRQFIAWGAGAANWLPNNVTAKIEGLGVQTEPFERYFDAQRKKATLLGATISSDNKAGNVSATESAITATQNDAIMVQIVNNTESAYKRLIAYCGMYMGLWGQEEIESNLDKITLNLPKEFSSLKLTYNDVTSLIAVYNSGLIDKETVINKMVAGGFVDSEVQDIMDRIDSSGVILSTGNDSSPVANN